MLCNEALVRFFSKPCMMAMSKALPKWALKGLRLPNCMRAGCAPHHTLLPPCPTPRTSHTTMHECYEQHVSQRGPQALRSIRLNV
eukprot:13603063-Alexandrium_andersonii.AAC.1